MINPVIVQEKVVQVATPYSQGSGFILKNFVITNEHVVRDAKEVTIIDGRNARFKGLPLYIDVFLDIAIIDVCDLTKSGDLKVCESISLGDAVMAHGYPYGHGLTSTAGVISNLDFQVAGISYILHDAALNPGQSGGPLIDSDGRLIGINSSIFNEGKNMGLALPIETVVEAIELCKANQLTQRCHSCRSTFDDKQPSPICPYCGVKVRLIHSLPDYAPTGISKIIEDVISSFGCDQVLARRGTMSWMMNQGSATVSIQYHESSGTITMEALLAKLPNHNLLKLYEYLLRENLYNHKLSFSVEDQDISLSTITYDQYIESATFRKSLQELLVASDKYDNIIQKF